MIDTKHQQYISFIDKVEKCRDVVAGEEAVKERGELYLPALEDQDGDDYAAYLRRGFFYGATGRTLNALVGAIFRKQPVYVYPDEERLNSVTLDGKPLTDFAELCCRELLTTGRIGILVDMPPAESNTAYFSLYSFENMINWKVELVDSQLRLQFVVLQEKIETEGDDEFEVEQVEQLRILKLEGGIYTVDLYRKNNSGEWILHETHKPLNKGKPFDFIPFIFVNPDGVSFDVVNPPLLDLVNINLSHYRSATDLEHGRHYTALPTAWVAGFPIDSDLSIGSRTAWVTDNPDGRAGYLEFTGNGLRSLETALEQKEYMMAVLGTRLLDVPKKAVESADTHRMRNMGEQNVLSNISSALSEAFSISLTYLYGWERSTIVTNSVDISVRFNKDFDSARLPYNELVALTQALQVGGISWETYFYNLKRGELIEEGVSEEDEQDRIMNGVMMMPPPSQGNK